MAGRNTIFDGTVESASSRQNSIGGITVRTTTGSGGDLTGEALYVRVKQAGNFVGEVASAMLPTGFTGGVELSLDSTTYYIFFNDTSATMNTALDNASATTIHTQTF